MTYIFYFLIYYVNFKTSCVSSEVRILNFFRHSLLSFVVSPLFCTLRYFYFWGLHLFMKLFTTNFILCRGVKKSRNAFTLSKPLRYYFLYFVGFSFFVLFVVWTLSPALSGFLFISFFLISKYTFFLFLYYVSLKKSCKVLF